MTTETVWPRRRLRVVGADDETELQPDSGPGDETGPAGPTDEVAGAGPVEVLSGQVVRTGQSGQEFGQVREADRAADEGPGRRTELAPVIPPVLRDREQRRSLARHLTARAGHAVAFHAVRSPKYAGRAAVRAPVGAVRVCRSVVRVLADAEGRPLRTDAVEARDPKAYMVLVKERNARVRLRLQAAALLAFLTAALLTVAVLVLGVVVLVVVGGVVFVVLARLGCPPGRPLVESSVTTFEVPRLTHPMILAALGAIGIGAMNASIRAGEGPSFPSDVARDGDGYRAEVDLPLGVTVGDVMDRRDRLASALRRPLGTVWPEGDPDVHEGRLALWVGDRDLSKSGTIPWTLAKHGGHDVFKPFVFGRDPRGRTVTAPLIYHNWLIGSLPGQGKTASVRVIASAAALDPTCELWLHELKGSGDLDGLEPVAHRYVSGIDEESIAHAAQSLALLREEVRVRGRRLADLPRDIAPDKRVTRAIANRRSWGLHPIVCVIDECQNLFGDRTHGKQAGEDAEYLIKLGRAFGIVLVLATQRPDKDSLPTGVSGNVSIRFCLHVAGQVENDMILGTSAYKNGYRATMFRPEVEAGIGILKGATPAPIVLRTSYLDGPTTEAIGRRARAAREAAGLLTGHAAGEDTARERGPVLDVARDVLAVFEPGETACWNEVLVARLTDLRDDVYDGWTAAQLTGALKARGHDVVRDVHRAGTTKRGIRLDDLRAAVADAASAGGLEELELVDGERR